MEHSKSLWRGLFFILLIIALCGGLALPTQSSLAISTTVVISQLYGGGGNAGAPFTNDFIELHNVGDSPVSLNGWSVQYAGATGTSWSVTPLTNVSIAAGQYYLVQLAAGNTASNPLPAPDATGTTNMSATAGKVALVNTATALSNSGCPIDTSVVDFVGYGTTADCREGGTTTANNAPAPSSTLADLRGPGGNSCSDTDDNAANFSAVAPTPRNTASSPVYCVAATATPTDTGTATDTATATNTATITTTATNTGLATSTSTLAVSVPNVVISEFRTRGPAGANDEFIELYNPTSNWIDISSWRINASNDTGGTDTRATIPTSTILRSGQYYLVANNSSSGGYSDASVPANLSYGTGISDTGGIALIRPNSTISDQVGMSSGSTYKEGSTLTPLSGNSDQSYERKLGGASDSCQDTNNNANDFSNRSPSNPHNYSSPLSLCGVAGPPNLITTTTTITADTPDPSLVSGLVTVSVTVSVPSGAAVATGTINITGANTNCSINLTASSAGKGSCSVIFTSAGSKGLAATYLGDNTHAASSDTEAHSVATTPTVVRTRTPQPTPLPPPPLIGLNEFVPRPGHDWNNDGVINTGDEYIEVINHGVIDVNLSGYSLDDEANIGSNPFSLPSLTLKPGERHVFYGSVTGLLLGDGGDGVRLLKPNGQLGDAYNYTVVRFPDQSYCRLPDNGGLDDWNQNCFPTPGLQNSLSGSTVNPPTENGQEILCPISDTLPDDFVTAECLPFGSNIWNPAYWDKFGWFDEKYLPESPGKWPLFAE